MKNVNNHESYHKCYIPLDDESNGQLHISFRTHCFLDPLSLGAQNVWNQSACFFLIPITFPEILEGAFKMPEAVYQRLAEALALRGGAAPAIKCKEFFALLEELFTPAEADLAVEMPTTPIEAGDVSKEFGGRDPAEVVGLLEGMADKGIVFVEEKEGQKFYGLMPLVPGIFEMQFTKGEVNDRTRRLAVLFEDYFNLVRQGVRRLAEAAPGGLSFYPFARVIAVEQEIPHGVEIHPYDRVSGYIRSASHIAVSVCYCRHHGELMGRPCKKPKDVCMSFGPQAKFIAERGFGKAVSRDEALRVLERAEEADLVHCSSNTGKYLTFICNCCDCHCGIIQSLKTGLAPMAAVSGFVAAMDEDACNGCGSCLDRCQMDALTQQGDKVALNVQRCIGCGLCVSVCPKEALKLEIRLGVPEPPPGQRQLGEAMRSSLRHSP